MGLGKSNLKKKNIPEKAEMETQYRENQCHTTIQTHRNKHGRLSCQTSTSRVTETRTTEMFGC